MPEDLSRKEIQTHVFTHTGDMHEKEFRRTRSASVVGNCDIGIYLLVPRLRNKLLYCSFIGVAVFFGRTPGEGDVLVVERCTEFQ